jgi:uracil-DNA glycosylase family protein
MSASAADFLPPKRNLTSLRQAAESCRGCDLWKDATQTVFGEGRARAELMLVGEQPGDREDHEGEPFVGPAGGLLDRALKEASIAREDIYLTNAVKHFKWRPRGKRRLHQTPRAAEVEACRPWLEAELETIHPRAVVALGATAAKSLFGSSVRVTRDRGRLLETPLAPIGAVTVHPSAILRVRDREERQDALAGLVEDLEAVSTALENLGKES